MRLRTVALSIIFRYDGHLIHTSIAILPDKANLAAAVIGLTKGTNNTYQVRVLTAVR